MLGAALLMLGPAYISQRFDALVFPRFCAPLLINGRTFCFGGRFRRKRSATLPFQWESFLNVIDSSSLIHFLPSFLSPLKARDDCLIANNVCKFFDVPFQKVFIYAPRLFLSAVFLQCCLQKPLQSEF